MTTENTPVKFTYDHSAVIEIYRQISTLLMSKTYPVHELEMLSNATTYLAHEIHNYESTQAAVNPGPESEAPVL